MLNKVENLKKHILILTQGIIFNNLYTSFIQNKNFNTFNELNIFLNMVLELEQVCGFELNSNKKKLKILLLDDMNNIIWSNHHTNTFEKYIGGLNQYDINNLFAYFQSTKNINWIEFPDANIFILDNGIRFVIQAEQNVWKEPINGYYYWQGNFVGASPQIQFYFDKVSSPQTNYQQPSNLISTSGQFNYYGNTFPSNLNMIVLFTGYSKATDVLNNLTNYTTHTNMYVDAKNYFQSNNVQNYLLSLCFGGGVSQTGGWDTGSAGAIYSIYQACTKKGVQFSYQETGTGNTLSGVGTGLLDYSYNSFTFDIETWGNNKTSGSTGKDFINLFNYIKLNPNSTLYSWEMIIIVTIAHSCSNYNGTGQKVISDLLSDTTGSYDFISPQLYTQNTGTTNEYCANYNILWSNTGSNDNFAYYLSQNKNYIKYGQDMILPSLNYNYLLNTGGSNSSNPPNLYFYQSSSNSVNPPVPTASGWKTITYQTDVGANDFFNNIFGLGSGNLGGSIQWVNGNLV